MKKNKTLRDLYEAEKAKPTPAQAWIEAVCDLTKASEITVRNWIAGRQVPDALARETLGKHFGIPAERLFDIKKEER